MRPWRERAEETMELHALVPAALLHRLGLRYLLLYGMRENWDAKALKALGYASVDDFLRATDPNFDPPEYEPQPDQSVLSGED